MQLQLSEIMIELIFTLGEIFEDIWGKKSWGTCSKKKRVSETNMAEKQVHFRRTHKGKVATCIRAV